MNGLRRGYDYRWRNVCFLFLIGCMVACVIAMYVTWTILDRMNIKCDCKRHRDQNIVEVEIHDLVKIGAKMFANEFHFSKHRVHISEFTDRTLKIISNVVTIDNDEGIRVKNKSFYKKACVTCGCCLDEIEDAKNFVKIAVDQYKKYAKALEIENKEYEMAKEICND